MIAVVGLGVGILYGLFGVGSAFATPVLSLFGVAPMAAVVGPLPALLPGAATGAWSYSRARSIDWWVARQALIGAFPAAVLGAVASRWVGGPILLIASGVVLLVVGVRVIRASGGHVRPRLVAAHDRGAQLLAAAVVVGFMSGLLANGGGFLLVPLFLLYLGLDMAEATGTSLVVAAALTVPTLATHALIGDINWVVSGFFALGLVPGTRGGALLSRHLPTRKLQASFGALLVTFALWYLVRLALQ